MTTHDPFIPTHTIVLTYKPKYRRGDDIGLERIPVLRMPAGHNAFILHTARTWATVSAPYWTEVNGVLLLDGKAPLWSDATLEAVPS